MLRALRRGLVRAAVVVVTAGAVVAGASSQVLAFDYTGYIWKVKSTWGGGYALNVGKVEGTYMPGAGAILWWNHYNDYNSRWAWISQANGWYLYQNVYSGRCLSAQGAYNNAWVVQQPCNGSDDRQRWRFDDSLGSIHLNRPIRNRYVDLNSSATRVLTQFSAYEGAAIVMAAWEDDYTRQYWSIVYCGMLDGYGNVQSMQVNC